MSEIVLDWAAGYGMIILIPMNEKYEPMIIPAEQVERENMRFYRITQTVRRL